MNCRILLLISSSYQSRISNGSRYFVLFCRMRLHQLNWSDLEVIFWIFGWLNCVIDYSNKTPHGWTIKFFLAVLHDFDKLTKN